MAPIYWIENISRDVLEWLSSVSEVAKEGRICKVECQEWAEGLGMGRKRGTETVMEKER